MSGVARLLKGLRQWAVFVSVERRSEELWLRYADAGALANDYESNLRKGRAFVSGASGLGVRQACTVVVEHPQGGTFRMPAEAVWIADDPSNPGTGVEFVQFDAPLREGLARFVEPRQSSESGDADDAAPDSTPLSQSSPSARNLHDRVRDLDIASREALARQASLPERVALERRFGSSVWESLLHNPQITAREVCRMAKSTSLPPSLVNLIVNNKGWLADGGVQRALIENPRVSGAHLDRVLRALPQSELVRIAELTSVRMQVRVAAKKLIRR